MKNLKKAFENAVLEYRRALAHNFYCRQGSECDRWENGAKENVFRLYKESPAEARESLQLIAMKTLSAAAPPRDAGLYDSYETAARFTNILREKANDLVKELETIN
jgi:hypothetical protein